MCSRPGFPPAASGRSASWSLAMRLETLLPRPLDPSGGSECATLMGSLFAAIHLDRRRARALGWRGVRPSGLLRPAWTCRVAGSDLVFGLVFTGEARQGDALCGDFAAYAFPRPEDALLERFPLEALRLAGAEGYGDAVRALSAHADDLAPFHLGTLSLAASLDGSGLSLRLRAPARRRMISLDGVGLDGPAGVDWVVRPGEAEFCAFSPRSRPRRRHCSERRRLLSWACGPRHSTVSTPGAASASCPDAGGMTCTSRRHGEAVPDRSGPVPRLCRAAARMRRTRPRRPCVRGTRLCKGTRPPIGPQMRPEMWSRTCRRAGFSRRTATPGRNGKRRASSMREDCGTVRPEQARRRGPPFPTAAKPRKFPALPGAGRLQYHTRVK